MNKKRLTKTIIFLTIGVISFIPLIFLSDILALFLNKELNNLRTLDLISKISKAAFIILGIIFLMIGLYNLVMMFTENEDEDKNKN